VQTRTLLTLRSTPLGGGTLVVGKLLVPVALAPAQSALAFGLLALNGIPVHAPLWILGVQAAIAVLLGCLGVLLAVLLHRPGQAQAVYAVAVLAVLALGLLLPRDPFNLFAFVASTGPDVSAWVQGGVLAAAALVAFAGTVPVAARRIWRHEAA
jgi:ABC-type Na+ efflux pump permease subunit